MNLDYCPENLLVPLFARGRAVRSCSVTGWTQSVSTRTVPHAIGTVHRHARNRNSGEPLRSILRRNWGPLIARIPATATVPAFSHRRTRTIAMSKGGANKYAVPLVQRPCRSRGPETRDPALLVSHSTVPQRRRRKRGSRQAKGRSSHLKPAGWRWAESHRTRPLQPEPCYLIHTILRDNCCRRCSRYMP